MAKKRRKAEGEGTSNAYRLALSGLAAIGADIFGKTTDRNQCDPSPLHLSPAQSLGLELAGAA